MRHATLLQKSLSSARRKGITLSPVFLVALAKVSEISTRRLRGKLKGKPRKKVSVFYVETEVRYILDIAAYVYEVKVVRLMEWALIEWLEKRADEISGSISRLRSKSRPVVGVSRKNLAWIMKDCVEFLKRNHIPKSPRSLRDFSVGTIIVPVKQEETLKSFGRKAISCFTVEFDVKNAYDLATRTFKIPGSRIAEEALLEWLLRHHAEIAYGLFSLKTTIYSQASMIAGEGLPAVFKMILPDAIKSKLEGAMTRASLNRTSALSSRKSKGPA